MPGIGALLITSIQNNDIPVIMAITFTFSVLVVVFNVVADVHVRRARSRAFGMTEAGRTDSMLIASLS